MSSLIPFENRSPVDSTADLAAAEQAVAAPLVDVATLHGRRRVRRPVARDHRRREHREWDPAFHVDLLTF